MRIAGVAGVCGLCRFDLLCFYVLYIDIALYVGFVMKKLIVFLKGTIRKFNKWKKDINDINNYRPYLTVRVVNKMGRRHWLFCKKQRREVHLLSDGEFRAYKKLLWQPGVIRVMEQFALDIDKTLDIAVSKNYRHPRNWETNEAHVMTTDFLVQKYDLKNPSRVITTAYSFKYWDQIFVLSPDEEEASWNEAKEEVDLKPQKKSARTWQKFEIEEIYWNNRGVQYEVITENFATKEEAWNIRFCESAWQATYTFDESNYFVEAFIEAWQSNFKKTLTFILKLVATRLTTSEEKALELFKYCALNHLLPLKHSNCLQPYRHLELAL